MARAPRRGDRQRRADQRNLFLDLLLAARRSFYLSYTGRSVRDNSSLPPSVLVVRTARRAGAGHRRRSGRSRFAQASPRASCWSRIRCSRFRQQAFAVDGDQRLRSFDSELAEALRESLQAAVPGLTPDCHPGLDPGSGSCARTPKPRTKMKIRSSNRRALLHRGSRRTRTALARRHRAGAGQLLSQPEPLSLEQAHGHHAGVARGHAGRRRALRARLSRPHGPRAAPVARSAQPGARRSGRIDPARCGGRRAPGRRGGAGGAAARTGIAGALCAASPGGECRAGAAAAPGERRTGRRWSTLARAGRPGGRAAVRPRALALRRRAPRRRGRSLDSSPGVVRRPADRRRSGDAVVVQRRNAPAAAAHRCARATGCAAAPVLARLRQPLPFFPKAAWKFASSGGREAEARNAWFVTARKPFAEGADPAYQLAFRGMVDPLAETDFYDVAMAVFAPVLQDEGAAV